MELKAIVREASDALVANHVDRLQSLCTAAEQMPSRHTPANLAEYAALLSVLRRQVLAARSNIVLRQRLLGIHTEAPWVP